MAHGGPRELQRQRRETRMVAREVTRADGDVVGAAVAEALVDVAITEVIAEDVVVAETEETGAREAREVKERVTAEAEGGRGDSMTTAEKTDGTIDLAVEVVDVAGTEVVEAPGEAEVRMATVNKRRLVW